MVYVMKGKSHLLSRATLIFHVSAQEDSTLTDQTQCQCLLLKVTDRNWRTTSRTDTRPSAFRQSWLMNEGPIFMKPEATPSCIRKPVPLSLHWRKDVQDGRKEDVSIVWKRCFMVEIAQEDRHITMFIREDRKFSYRRIPQVHGHSGD